jgi:DNA repair protein RadD
LKLRPIQEKAKADILASFSAGGTYHLCEAVVSFGKTILSSSLMETALTQHGAKCLFLAHLQELVIQTYEKFVKTAPHLADRVGIFNAGLARKEVADITIGSRQSVARGLKFFGKINLIIIDEVHLMSDDGEFDRIIEYFLKLNPRLRVLGITGTPYRLKTGLIYGAGKRFPSLAHKTGMEEMIEAGYLSKFRYKLRVDPRLKEELDNLNLVGGEYNQGELSETMQDGMHMNSVKIAIEEHARDRKSIIVFATSIDHAERLAFVLGGKAVHSKMRRDDIRDRIDLFKSGDLRVLVNVGVLAIGFDAPNVDCAVLARPTLSPAMYVQMIGRALRISPEKRDALILDLVGNYHKHGSPMNPIVSEARKKSEQEPDVCPSCFEIVPLGEKVCPECDFDMTSLIEERKRKERKLEEERLKLEEIDVKKSLVTKKWTKDDHITMKGNEGVLFCIKIKGRSKPLFKFSGKNSSWLPKIIENFNKIQVGQMYEVESTGYGDWLKI